MRLHQRLGRQSHPMMLGIIHIWNPLPAIFPLFEPHLPVRAKAGEGEAEKAPPADKHIYYWPV